MKWTLISGLTILFSSLMIASAANAKPVNFNDSIADLNGDGTVSMYELHQYHLDTSTK